MIQILAAVPSALAIVVGAYFVRKKSKEDTSLASLTHAITVWKDIAEDARKAALESKEAHRACEEKTEKLEAEITKLKTDMLFLKLRVGDAHEK